MLHKVVGVEEVRYQSPSYILGPGPEEIRLCVADGWRAARQAICQSKPKPCPARTHMADCGSAYHTDGRRGAVIVESDVRSVVSGPECGRCYCSMVRGPQEECRVDTSTRLRPCHMAELTCGVREGGWRV
jgi:hypothetical protein